jgi:hypothetical protein
MTVETSSSSAAPDGDALLIDEIAPAMLAKLKNDSRQKMMSQGITAMFAAAMLVFGNGTYATWLNVLFTVSGVVFCALGLVTIYKAHYGAPSGFQEELAYRRRSGKWRWER